MEWQIVYHSLQGQLRTKPYVVGGGVGYYKVNLVQAP